MAVLVLAGLLGGLAAWFSTETQRLASVLVNQTLVDVPGTADAITQITRDLETVSSYKYTDLDADQQAADNVIAGKFRTEYDSLFAQVKAQAPGQKAVVAGQVAMIGLRELQGGNAILLTFITQNTTKTGSNQSIGLVYTVNAQRIDGKWKITELTPR